MALRDTKHLNYYEKELTFLRNAGKDFAKRFPKVANRLGLSGVESPDPHVERLLESFAFLTSYLQKDIDDQFPRLASTLLSLLYPQLSAPLPPMSIAHFELDPSKGKLTSGYQVEKNFSLMTKSETGEICRFRTSYPLTLWPIKITDIAVVRADLYDFANQLSPYPLVLKLNLATESLDFETLEMNNLQFYINAEPVLANTLFEYLFLTDNKYAIVAPNDEERPYRLINKGNIERVGFKLEENVLPDFPQSHPAYRLLQEYFVFPEKFHFFNLKNLDLKGATKTIELVIPLSTYNDHAAKQLLINEDTIKLGCTPIINLFPKVTDPIRFDKKQIEYNLYPDIRRMTSLEIHSIEKVVTTEANTPDTKDFSPYFSYNHEDIENTQQAFWYARRVLSDDPNVPGTTVKLAFVDLDFNPEMPAVEVAYARTLCTNRGLSMFVHAGTVLQPEASVPTKSVTCLHQPTPSVYAEKDGASQWKLISQLSLNYLSLSSGTESLKALKEILTLYAGAIEDTIPLEINNIVAMKTQHVVRRFGQDAWRGFVKGTAATLTLDNENFNKKEALLFSAVLSHFFGLYASVNSFVELSIQKPTSTEIWKTWKPIGGETPLL